MRSSAIRLILVVVLAATVGACGLRALLAPTPVPVPPRPLGPGEVWVPIANWTLPDGGQLLCAGGGFVGDYRLHGSASDPRIVWMTDPHGTREEVAWPVGYSARFRPSLELLDEHGDLVGREGTLVVGSCTTVDPNVQQVELETPKPPPSESAI